MVVVGYILKHNQVPGESPATGTERLGGGQMSGLPTIRPRGALRAEEREWLMGEMIPFRYGGFWDVPRFILLRYRGKALLLESPFDESLDEYPDDYAVYVLPNGTEWSELPQGSWIRVETPRSLIGRIPIGEVAFDPTKRKALDSGRLDTLFAQIPTSMGE